ncbi:MAG: serine/threonine protein kinase, partial [Acidobacteriota bacterium]|nr:serine/threonine protein kinase [Acidobacteriota bacterium]
NQTANEYIRWYQPRVGAYNPSPILYRGIYYTLLDRGFLTAHDAFTGQIIYNRVRIEPGATFTSSPWAYNGKIFALSEDGTTYVIAAGAEYQLLGKNDLEELSLASPAIAGGTLLLRTASSLYAIRR